LAGLLLHSECVANSLMPIRETSRLIPSKGPFILATSQGPEGPSSLRNRYLQL